MSEYERKIATHRSGTDPFRDGPRALEFNLDGFWRWSGSDLLSNATRGVLAEYIVAQALGVDVDGSVRDEWGACDLFSRDGVKIEVKSCAYLQSWHQNKLSKISFSVRKTRVWDATNILSHEPRRQAEVYVFALLAHTDKATVDPLDLSQWRFYVLPTSVLDRRTRSQHSITLRSLEALTSPLPFGDLKAGLTALAGGSPGSAEQSDGSDRP